MPHLTPASNAPEPTEAAVIVPIAAAEPAVGAHRYDLDPAERWGVPAHVTVLYPFVDPSEINEEVMATLTTAVAPVHAFDCEFADTRWFGDDVLWLAPQPDQPFRQLTAAVWQAFPQHPPYGGIHDDVVPHLTVAESHNGANLTAMRAAARAAQASLPIRAHIDTVLVIAGTTEPNSWRILQELRLTTGSSTP